MMGELVEEIVEFLSGAGTRGVWFFGAIPKREIVAEIGCVLVHHSLSLGFPALIIAGSIVEHTIKTAMKIRSAMRTAILPSRFAVAVPGGVTMITGFHKSHS